MNETARTFLSAAASVVNQKAPGPGLFDSQDREALHKLADFHQMTAITAAALEAAGVEDPLFMQEQARAIRKNLLLDHDREEILAALEAAGIWYMPLKGVILKEYYPQYGLREMSDNDILFDAARAEDVRAIMESLGFTTVRYGIRHQDDYQKPPLSHFEMHRMLFSSASDERLFRYYEHVDERLLDGTGHEKHFSQEDFYIYMIAHEFKHFWWNGTGVRSLLDVYVYLQIFRESLDWDYIREEMKKLGIPDFEEKNRALAETVFRPGFDPAQLDTEQTEMLECFLSAGAYGTMARGIQNSAEKKGKRRYILRRIFLPMEQVRENAPFFYRHKILLPLLPVYRLVRGRKRVTAEIKALKKVKKHKSDPDKA